MFLSCLTIDTSSTRGRNWLGNPYRIHQRLCMAFDKTEAGRLLFRVEAEREPARVIVQSRCAADWDAAFRGHPVLLSPPIQKRVESKFRRDQRLRFLLRANPTVRRLRPSMEGGGERRPGQRLGLLREADQRDWLRRKGDEAGFEPLVFEANGRGLLSFTRGDHGRQTHLCVDFEGYLRVVDPERFASALLSGIGAAKGFGFGLLSVAPA